MAENSKIEWTDHTVNLWWGCTKVHLGCDNCYAETLSHRWGESVWGDSNKRKRIKSAFSDLDKFQKQSKENNKISRVFVGSMMDIFEKSKELANPFFENQNTGDIRNELFGKITAGKYDNLVFLFLTKRPSNINKYVPSSWIDSPPDNVWFGTSPVDQKTFDNLVPNLKRVKGKLFLSLEPQLDLISNVDLNKIGWVIQGGESGHNRRPFNLLWAETMKKESQKQGVPYFFKQIDKVLPVPKNYFYRELPIY